MCWSVNPKFRPSFTFIIDHIKRNNFDLIQGMKNPSNSIFPVFNSSDTLLKTLSSKYYLDISIFEGISPYSNKCKAPGSIIEGEQTKNEIICVFKKFERRDFNNKDNIESFYNEIAIHSSLKHIGIIPFIGYTTPCTYHDYFSIFWEYMPKGKLNKLIESVSRGNCPKNWETIKSINIFGIAAAMAYIHQHKIMFRNLTTENIVLDKNYYPKIINFESSKYIENDFHNDLIGTPIYMAPEQYDMYYNEKVDVYAYSMVLYELLIYEVPWKDKKNFDLFRMMNIVNKGERPIIRNNEITDDYLELIKRCWDQNPNNRPSFISIVEEFMENKDKYFDLNIIDEEQLEDYIELATKDLVFQ